MEGLRRALVLAALLVLPGVAGAAGEAGPLRAFFTLAPSIVSTGANVTADAAASTGDVREVAWDWGDGDGAFAPGARAASHAYRQAGVFVVRLRVTDGEGRASFANQSVLVRGDLPEPYFQPRTTARDGGVEVAVDASYSTPSKGASRIVSYEWDWGDGSGGYVVGNVTETHFYETPGNYGIHLRVTDDQGRNATVQEFVLVKSTFFGRVRELWTIRQALVDGAKITLELTLVTTVLGFAIAVVLALLRISDRKLLSWPAAVYIEVIRGTPLFVQVLIAWLALPYVGIKLSVLVAGGLALTVNTSAYQAEAIRAGIQGIPTGQLEAASGLGLSYLQSMRFVVVPQAFRLTLPALGNEVITLLKDTSLVSAIGVYELTQVGRIFSVQSFLVLETWLVVAAIYFVMTYALSTALRHVERRLAIPGLGIRGGAP